MSRLLLTEGLRQPTVFLSYSLHDRVLAAALERALKTEGADLWSEREQLKPGDRWRDKILAGIDSADVFAVLISSNSLGSGQNEELAFVLQRRLSGSNEQLAVAVLTGDAEIPPVLRDNIYFDLRDGDTERVAKGIIASMRNNLDLLYRSCTSLDLNDHGLPRCAGFGEDDD